MKTALDLLNNPIIFFVVGVSVALIVGLVLDFILSRVFKNK